MEGAEMIARKDIANKFGVTRHQVMLFAELGGYKKLVDQGNAHYFRLCDCNEWFGGRMESVIKKRQAPSSYHKDHTPEIHSDTNGGMCLTARKFYEALNVCRQYSSKLAE